MIIKLQIIFPILRNDKYVKVFSFNQENLLLYFRAFVPDGNVNIFFNVVNK